MSTSLVSRFSGINVDTVVAACTVILLAGCGPMVIQSDPALFRVPPEAAAKLRGQQTLLLRNAYEKETPVIILPRGVGWQADLRQYTETAIVLLSGEMTRKGIDLSPQAIRSVTLRVHDVRADHIPYKSSSSLVLEAQYGDGTKSIVATKNSSPLDGSSAVSGAIMFAVTQLLRDENFLAYVNR